jgi:hypothetical protein
VGVQVKTCESKLAPPGRAPNQTVLPVAVALVLKTHVKVHLGGVVIASILAPAGSLYSSLDDRVVRFKMQADVAL